MSVIATAAQMTPAGYIITYLIFPIIVLLVPAAILAAFRANRASKASAVARGRRDETLTARMDTQDNALARILEVVSPAGQPSLDAVLARIQATQDAHDKRLTEHIQAAAVDKALIEQRIANIRPGGS